MVVHLAKKTLAIFDTFKTKRSEFTGEALRQRAIITCLAQAEASSDKTRTSISQYIAKENNVVWKNIYTPLGYNFSKWWRRNKTPFSNL